MFRKGMLWIGKALAAGCIAVGILCLITLGYKYTSVHYPSQTGATDFIIPSRFRTTADEGFGWIRLDDDGFNNLSMPDENGIDILLMGSSQMAAVQVPQNANTGALLNTLLPDRFTYNIGMDKHEFITCMNNVQNAVEYYAPKELVIVQTEEVELSIEDIKQAIEGEYAELPSYNEGFMFYMQKYIPFAKSLYSGLNEWKRLAAAPPPEQVEDDESAEYYESAEYRSLLTAYFEKTVAPIQQAGIRLIIFYIPPTGIEKNGEMSFTTNEAALAAFRQSCEDSGIIFFDMTPDFARLYEQNHKAPYGFANSEVGEGHLNRYGHQVIAQRLASEIHSLL